MSSLRFPRIRTLSFVLPILLLLISTRIQAEKPAPTNPAAKVQIEALKLALGSDDVDKAIEAGEKAVKADPASGEAQHWLGQAYGAKAQKAGLFSKMSWAKKCKGAFEAAVKLDPESLEARFDLIAFHVQAPGIAGGDDAEAKKHLAELAKRNQGWAQMAEGMRFRHEKDLVKAEEAFKKAAASDPADPRLFGSLVNFYIGQKNWDAAAALCRKAQADRPDDVYAGYQLARVANRRESNYEEGLAPLDRYLTKEPAEGTPSWADAHALKGVLLGKAGRKDDAKAELQTALKLQPGHAMATRELKKM